MHARRKGITWRAVSPAVSDGECFSETGAAGRGILADLGQDVEITLRGRLLALTAMIPGDGLAITVGATYRGGAEMPRSRTCECSPSSRRPMPLLG